MFLSMGTGMAVFSVNNILRPSLPLRLPPLNPKHLKNSNPVPPVFTAPHPVSSDLAPALPSDWAKFSQNVSGEWDGFGADFTAEGNPVELPESVVPEAYREWEVKVFDWQTQCPTLALAQSDDDGRPSFTYKNITLLPTVGCEADAATRHTIQERDITTAAAPESPAFAYQSTGCYVALWPSTAAANRQLMELEHCLIDPRDRESRVRIIQVLEVRKPERSLELRSVRVFVEQWYGPFRNGDQLGGCAMRDSTFAATQPLKASQVSGVWQGTAAVATFTADRRMMMIQQLRGGFVRKSGRDGGNLTLLPKQLWCGLIRERTAEAEETCCEAGWLLAPGNAITSRCTFSSTGELREIAVATETAIPV